MRSLLFAVLGMSLFTVATFVLAMLPFHMASVIACGLLLPGWLVTVAYTYFAVQRRNDAILNSIGKTLMNMNAPMPPGDLPVIN